MNEESKSIIEEQAERKSIIEEQAERINELYLKQLNEEKLASRHYYEDPRPRSEGQFQRDYTRIIYSSSFRRLQGKMQLLGIKEEKFFRNRLTHSLEVSQIARSFATKLNYDIKTSYVVEAGALAHDLGNPPFGHSGERKLNELFKDVGGFEGNAQTLRILTHLEKKNPDFPGMNLTYRTLLSVVKYFKKYDKNEKEKQKFIYDEDYELLKDYIHRNDVRLRTLDVQIVDISDEIAYAAHDLEDGLWNKSFNIDEILYDYENKYGNTYSYEVLADIVKECHKKAKNSMDSSEFSNIFRKELSSMIVNYLINDVGLNKVSYEEATRTGTRWDKELGFTKLGELAKGLKRITFECINHNDEVYSYEKHGDEVLETLVNTYRDDPKYLPPEYRAENLIKKYKMDTIKEKLQERLICDYVSGMMDSYAIATYKKFKS